MSPTAFVQIDLDGLWSVRECYGLEVGTAFEDDPVYLEGIERFAALLDRRKLSTTFFVTGKDLEIERKCAALKDIAAAGHELANHSYSHILGLTTLDDAAIEQEITKTQHMFESRLGMTPIGFRAPGYDIDERILRILHTSGFKYDSSLLPTYWGFVMRVVDRHISRSRKRTKRQFGKTSYGKAPLHPYFPDPSDIIRLVPEGPLIELPVSVTPFFRLPIHFGAGIKMGLGHVLRTLKTYAKRNIELNYVFHGVDFVGMDSLGELAKGRLGKMFATSLEKRMNAAAKILDTIRALFDVTTPRRWIDEGGHEKYRTLRQ